LSGLLVTNHQSPVTIVFSTTYELPILQPLCFDIHASDGGCTPPPNLSTFKCFNLQTFNDLSSFFSHSSELFCTFLHLRKTQLVSFQAIPNSFTKTPGVGALLPPRAPSCSEWGGGPSGNRWQPSPAILEVSSQFRAGFCFLGPGLFPADHPVRFLDGTNLYHFDVASSRSRGLQ
jgi:hypothetical protein